ncbi:uncharacterized protein K441DRAFT_618765 [Cenococcum geophilum 1.58]|uniref:uncharacterized protein n=1 Tax=Cenococcum geophilum 1.58 TaxID=794803 RepID=UPI00358E0C74|nr:hypothetical protein K441DRAFT_618765 [Cenococcum geophilum 1.58]
MLSRALTRRSQHFARALLRTSRPSRSRHALAAAPPAAPSFQTIPKRHFTAYPARRKKTNPQPVIDQKMEEIQDLYATARDEFEIAAEETEKQTVYAADDRAAARDELAKLVEAYKRVVEGPDAEVGEEVRRRVGQRIRELENAVTAMEEMALGQG